MAAKGPVKGNEHRFSLGSKLLLSNALSMLNNNLTGFVQSLFSVQSICTVRKGSASRVVESIPSNFLAVGRSNLSISRIYFDKYKKER